jgi:hypothetical protein
VEVSSSEGDTLDIDEERFFRRELGFIRIAMEVLMTEKEREEYKKLRKELIEQT